MNQIQQSIENDKRAPHIFVCANGVQLKLRAVPSLAIVAIQKQLKEPPVPTFFNDEKQRDEENPNDPNYIRELNEWRAASADATTTAYLANGVTVITPLPDNVEPVDSQEWSEGLVLSGLVIADSGIQRRVAWLKYYIVGDEDLGDLIGQIAIAGGLVTEEAVQDVAATFRNNGTGNTDTTDKADTEV